jgi:hypothetical protein
MTSYSQNTVGKITCVTVYIIQTAEMLYSICEIKYCADVLYITYQP